MGQCQFVVCEGIPMHKYYYNYASALLPFAWGRQSFNTSVCVWDSLGNIAIIFVRISMSATAVNAGICIQQFSNTEENLLKRFTSTHLKNVPVSERLRCDKAQELLSCWNTMNSVGEVVGWKGSQHTTVLFFGMCLWLWRVYLSVSRPMFYVVLLSVLSGRNVPAFIRSACVF